MRSLVSELFPHAPQLGLYVVPNIPGDKLRNALRDYAGSLDESDVLALYDATLMGGAKDGAVFTADQVVFQNNDLEPVHVVRYADIVQVDEKRRLISGRKIQLEVNRGRATFSVTMDFSGKADAAPFVARFLREAMLHGAAREMGDVPPEANPGTDVEAVRGALQRLVDDSRLAPADFDRLLAALGAR